MIHSIVHYSMLHLFCGNMLWEYRMQGKTVNANKAIHISPPLSSSCVKHAKLKI